MIHPAKTWFSWESNPGPRKADVRDRPCTAMLVSQVPGAVFAERSDIRGSAEGPLQEHPTGPKPGGFEEMSGSQIESVAIYLAC